MEILEGSMSFTIDGKKRIVSAGDPPILIKRGQVHSITASKPNFSPTTLLDRRVTDDVHTTSQRRTPPSHRTHYPIWHLQSAVLPGFIAV